MSRQDTQENNIDQCLRGHLLLAMPSLNAGLFSKSVTYICEHGEAGAMGLIINRPLDLTISEIFTHLKIDSVSDYNCNAVMAGGPVQVDQGFVLHRDASTCWESCTNVSNEILLTTSKDILSAIAQNKGPKEHLIALGYAGWSPGQLEEELNQNSWLTTPADSDIIFSTPYEERLSAAASKIGIDMNLISAQAGHA